MNLADILGAPQKGSPFKPAQVVSHQGSTITVKVIGGDVPGVRCLESVPPVGANVVVGWAGTQLICFGKVVS